MSRLQRRLRAEDSGIGMVELLVSMMLSAILLALVGTMFVNVAHATIDANRTREGSTSAANIANALSKVVRSSVRNAVSGQANPDPGVLAGTPDSITVYSLVDADSAAPAPVKVRFRVSGGELIEERWSATAGGGYWTFGSAAAETSRILGGTVVAPTGSEEPLFVYLDAAGAQIPAADSGLTAAQRETVAAVKVSVRVRPASAADAKTVVLQNTIGLPNIGTTAQAR
jgi:hypothetical protein